VQTVVVGKRVNLDDARHWSLTRRKVPCCRSRGFVTDVAAQGKLREFLVVDADESLAARQKFTGPSRDHHRRILHAAEHYRGKVATGLGKERRQDSARPMNYKPGKLLPLSTSATSTPPPWPRPKKLSARPPAKKARPQESPRPAIERKRGRGSRIFCNRTKVSVSSIGAPNGRSSEGHRGRNRAAMEERLYFPLANLMARVQGSGLRFGPLSSRVMHPLRMFRSLKRPPALWLWPIAALCLCVGGPHWRHPRMRALLRPNQIQKSRS